MVKNKSETGTTAVE
nr:unnamed protein product [Callosobruchus analis]